MNDKILYWSSIFFGVTSLLLLVANVSFVNGNRQLQEEVNQRQATINGGAALSQINNTMVQALAEIAIRNNDTDARGLLAAQGITISATNTSPATNDDIESRSPKKKPE